MKAILISLLMALVGFVIGVLVGYGMIYAFLPNQHDLSLEAAMTSFFVVGPVSAILFFVTTLAFQLINKSKDEKKEDSPQ